jgi:hypothetical protein
MSPFSECGPHMLAVVVPLIAEVIPLFRWPTLERRVRNDVSLTKELTDGMGKRSGVAKRKLCSDDPAQPRTH